MHSSDRRLVLLLGATSELMHDAIGHLDAPLRWTTRFTTLAPRAARDPTALHAGCTLRF
jgi:hypothetical protein